jgi:hypothetical protein
MSALTMGLDPRAESTGGRSDDVRVGHDGADPVGSSLRLKRKSTAAGASMTIDELALSLLTFLTDDLCTGLQLVQRSAADFLNPLFERWERGNRTKLLEEVFREAHAFGRGSCLERPVHLRRHIPDLDMWHVIYLR